MTVTYELRDGIHLRQPPVEHRSEHYDPEGFEALLHMQLRHFWYRGRHRFLLRSFARTASRLNWPRSGLRGIDLGGGCGGWIAYLLSQGQTDQAWALADSSLDALQAAAAVLPANIDRYQIDLLDLGWRERWDVCFLLDVLEHIPDQERVLREVHAALAPGGVLYITAPALQSFWSYNDELVHHVRRYSRRELAQLAHVCGYEPLDVRYFMFFLSPLLLASRWGRRTDVRQLAEKERHDLLIRTHRVPPKLVNEALAGVFAAETPLGHLLPFPWGTSILGVLRKR